MKREHLLYLVLFVLAASMALNIALTYKLRQFGGLNRPLTEKSLKAGTVVPAFQAADLKGQAQTIAYNIAYNKDSKPTVLYVFTPQCGWCKKNLDNLKHMIAKKGDEYRFIGLSLTKEGLPEYVGASGL